MSDTNQTPDDTDKVIDAMVEEGKEQFRQARDRIDRFFTQAFPPTHPALADWELVKAFLP